MPRILSGAISFSRVYAQTPHEARAFGMFRATRCSISIDKAHMPASRLFHSLFECLFSAHAMDLDPVSGAVTSFACPRCLPASSLYPYTLIPLYPIALSRCHRTVQFVKVTAPSIIAESLLNHCSSLNYSIDQ